MNLKKYNKEIDLLLQYIDLLDANDPNEEVLLESVIARLRHIQSMAIKNMGLKLCLSK